jgi:acetylornithine deacetylase/succinyl-diaminopimelate desuccinylase-like protein
MDHVFTPSSEQIEQLRRIPFEAEKMKEELEIDAFNRDLTGLKLLQKHLYEPTCTIQGLMGGYTGVGLKAVSPCEAMAKIEFRLVPNLEPDLVIDLLRAHLDRRGFEDIEILTHAALSPAQALPSAPVVRAAINATRELDGDDPIVYPWMAASGPMSFFSIDLGLPVVCAGSLWWHDARAHAPNESIRLSDYETGIRIIGRLVSQFAEAASHANEQSPQSSPVDPLSSPVDQAADAR